MGWLRRFGLHLAAAVGATGVLVASVAFGATQGRQAQGVQATQAAQTAQVSPARPRPAAKPSAVPQERLLAGTIQEVGPDSLVVVTPRQVSWTVRPAPGALIRLVNKSVPLAGLQPGERVVVLGQAQGRDQFLAHAITARLP